MHQWTSCTAELVQGWMLMLYLSCQRSEQLLLQLALSALTQPPSYQYLTTSSDWSAHCLHRSGMIHHAKPCLQWCIVIHRFLFTLMLLRAGVKSQRRALKDPPLFHAAWWEGQEQPEQIYVGKLNKCVSINVCETWLIEVVSPWLTPGQRSSRWGLLSSKGSGTLRLFRDFSTGKAVPKGKMSFWTW